MLVDGMARVQLPTRFSAAMGSKTGAPPAPLIGSAVGSSSSSACSGASSSGDASIKRRLFNSQETAVPEPSRVDLTGSQKKKRPEGKASRAVREANEKKEREQTNQQDRWSVAADDTDSHSSTTDMTALFPSPSSPGAAAQAEAGDQEETPQARLGHQPVQAA